MFGNWKLVVLILFWSNALITPHWGPSKRWLKHKFNVLNKRIKVLDSKTDRIDENVQIIKGELGK